MLKKTITYKDYNGVSRTEDFFFHLSKAELAELELSENGGYTEWVKSIVNAGDFKTLAKIFKDIIMKAYGIKTTDGKQFLKVDRDGYRLANDFVQTEAYSVLYMELITDDKKAAAFMNGLLPEEAKERLAEAQKNEQASHHPALNG